MKRYVRLVLAILGHIELTNNMVSRAVVLHITVPIS